MIVAFAPRVRAQDAIDTIRDDLQRDGCALVRYDDDADGDVAIEMREVLKRICALTKKTLRPYSPLFSTYDRATYELKYSHEREQLSLSKAIACAPALEKYVSMILFGRADGCTLAQPTYLVTRYDGQRQDLHADVNPLSMCKSTLDVGIVLVPTNEQPRALVVCPGSHHADISRGEFVYEAMGLTETTIVIPTGCLFLGHPRLIHAGASGRPSGPDAPSMVRDHAAAGLHYYCALAGSGARRELHTYPVRLVSAADAGASSRESASQAVDVLKQHAAITGLSAKADVSWRTLIAMARERASVHVTTFLGSQVTLQPNTDLPEGTVCCLSSGWGVVIASGALRVELVMSSSSENIESTFRKQGKSLLAPSSLESHLFEGAEDAPVLIWIEQGAIVRTTKQLASSDIWVLAPRDGLSVCSPWCARDWAPVELSPSECVRKWTFDQIRAGPLDTLVGDTAISNELASALRRRVRQRLLDK